MTESVVVFGPDERLVGVLTEPQEPTQQDTAVLVLNAGIVHRSGPNRLHVRLARALATAGFLVFRFDMAGIGDSDELDSADSVDEQCLTSVEAAADAMQRRSGVERFVLFGLCSGAEYAFRYCRRDPRIAALIGIDPPSLERSPKSYLLEAASLLRRPIVWLRLLRGRYGVTDRVVDAFRNRRTLRMKTRRAKALRRWIRAGLRDLVARECRLLLIVTGRGGRRYNYAEQIFDLFPRIGLEKIASVIRMPQANHTFGREADRRALENQVVDFVRTATPRTACPPSRGTPRGHG